MQEVRDLASGMKEAVEALRKASADAKASLQAEILRANTNAEKVRSLTSGLKDANKEVEAFLGVTNSNFEPEAAPKPAPRADINGVTLNLEARK